MARGRGELTPQEKEWMKTISNNINHYLKERNKKQIDLSRGTGIPASTLTGYVKGTSLPIAGNVQKIADYFGLKKSDIDPRFKPNQKNLIPPTFNMDPGKIILMANYDKLPKPKQDKLVAMSEALLSDKVTTI